MFIIALLTPGERINYMPGRFPDLPGKRPSRPDADSGVRMLSFYNGLHSSGHCSGFTPDSLLYDNRKSSYHLSGGKDRKLFKKNGILYYLNWFSRNNYVIASVSLPQIKNRT